MNHERDYFINFQGGLGSVKIVHTDDSYYDDILE